MSSEIDEAMKDGGEVFDLCCRRRGEGREVHRISG